MRNSFYLKMAGQNILKNRRLYLPFLISSIGTIMMTFVIQALATNSGLSQIPGGSNLQTILTMGYLILILFSAVFLFYINSFLMKNRKKEFGIYNILGMDKSHLTKMLADEMVIIWLISLIIGLVAGLLLNKVAILLVRRMLNAEVIFGFEFSSQAILWTFCFFSIIFLTILVTNVFQIRLSKPIELLSGSETGEKEPRARFFWTMAGLLLLGSGYYIALTVQSPIMGIQVVFLAILLVIAATYLLFIAGTITGLKLLKRKNSFYYQTRHFIPISGMLYRMKKNAVGLANISILSVGVVLMLSIVASLYMTTDRAVDSQYPRDVVSEVNLSSNEAENERQVKEQVEQALKETSDKTNQKMKNTLTYSYLSFPVFQHEDNFEVSKKVYAMQTKQKPVILNFIDQSNYQMISGKKFKLKENEVVIQGTNRKYTATELNILDKNFKVIPAETVQEFVIGSETTNQVQDSYYIIVNDIKTLGEIADRQMKILQEGTTNIGVFTQFDLQNATDQQKVTFSKVFKKKLKEKGLDIRTVDTRVEANGNFRALRSGILFLVLNIALLLLMMTVLIIYYKQISEAYDDQKRYQIMKKIGMSSSEIKQSVRSQILSVFFLPVLVAIFHIAVMFPIMKKVMVLVMLNQVELFPMSLLIAIAFFFVIYVSVYMLTAKTYYKIIQQS